MKAKINGHGDLVLWRHDEFRVNGRDAKVQDGDDDVERRRDYCQCILDAEECRAARDVGDGGDDEDDKGEREGNDGEKLHVPAVRLADGRLPIEQELPARSKGRDACNVPNE